MVQMTRQSTFSVIILLSHTKETIAYLAENQSRLADEIQFYGEIHYDNVQHVSPELALNVPNRFTGFDRITVTRPVQNVQRFLNFLKNFEKTPSFWCAQPQDLLDRLPEHCLIQRLVIDRAPSGFQFLFGLKNFTFLLMHSSIDMETVRKVLEELPFLLWFQFWFLDKKIAIQMENRKEFKIAVDGYWQVLHPNAAIRYVLRTRR